MKHCLWLVLWICLAITPAVAQDLQVVAGAGPSTRVVDLFFKEFSGKPAANGYQFSVPPQSTKHKGGIENARQFIFGRTGRPLNDAEQALDMGEIHLAMVPISFVAGPGVNISLISIHELEKIYRKKIKNWKTLGGPDAPIVTVGREPTEALFTELKNYYFFFRQVQFDKIFHRDHEVVEYLRTPEGRYAIVFGAEPNFYGMNLIYLKEDLQAGVRVGLVYDLDNEKHPLVQAAKKYATSEEWRQTLSKSNLGMIPVH